MSLVIAEDRHPATKHFAPFFSYDHLPPLSMARLVSADCCALADGLIDALPDGPELTAGLRKLLEAKDCFVRAAL